MFDAVAGRRNGCKLKPAPLLRYDTLALAALMILAMTFAVTRFRRTLD
jgi:hypothetical protein